MKPRQVLFQPLNPLCLGLQGVDLIHQCGHFVGFGLGFGQIGQNRLMLELQVLVVPLAFHLLHACCRRFGVEALEFFPV